ncbi:YeeE/YedE family protein [Sulfitobacter donghicola]|uniref:Lipocalin n=1 Tax=Sulfitobacter donghicola DSW-25 = KCTC 12864 = JCM 14565 TaxID=1300350 RepID=A0A073IW12_9RHOB|nr:YeeE/YedE family protein [Sulfitobacter donghicola]KEJ89532.1 lipocalin [Sulfitobacter donghicola DSW-25 = KCTC 12864 = JCM 14565]KIN69355.1 Lipocalin-related protein and Bos/Can/Equ allergen [Sulfitobacter donghicola DSW-25 = KCTC 12864 = JCM 14565]
MLEMLLDRWGDGAVLAAAGAVTGILFGAMAQHSRFCLRAATVELSEGKIGQRIYIWLIAFSAAVLMVQGAIVFGVLDVSEARPLAATGSMSGAMIGGAMFGCGMILARGCASRLLVLSATGNLRALVTGLVLTLVAQASLRGALSPLREDLAGLWLLEGGAGRNILSVLGMSSTVAAVLAAVATVAALVMAIRRGVITTHALAAAGVGVAVGLGWLLTFAIAQTSFEVVPISSVTFTGPSTDTLMGLVNTAELPLGFGVGLVPGVFIGAGGMALFSREAKIERFGPDTPMERYLIGAALMGFGSMLAGGCAVGAGMSGGSIFALTAWTALFFMWLGAMVTHIAMTRATAPRTAGA